MRTVFTWWTAIFAFVSFAALATAQDSPIFQTLDQYTRIQIPVTSGSSFRLLNGNPGESKLIVDRMRPEALSALLSVNDKRVKSVSVVTTGLDKAELTVKFQENGTEAFAYLQGSNLVLDLWRQEGAAAQPVAQAQPKHAAKLPSEVKKAKTSTRVIASVAKKAEKKKVNVSSVMPLESGKDLFQKFVLPMPELKITAKDGGLNLPPALKPEDKWKFTIGDKETDEGKVFELAKQLYSKKKYGLTTKTIEIALHNFPESEHNDELKLLQAFTYRKLAESTETPTLADKAEAMFLEMASQRDGEGNALAFTRILQFYFGQKEYSKENWLGAIQYFESVAATTPDSNPDFPYVQMVLADCYTKVNQGRRAERLYRFLAEKYPKHVLGKEGRYRIADLLGIEKNYARVIEEGEKALAEHPEYVKTRYEVLFQIGEAAFSLGQFARAEKYFRRFTEQNSAATTAGLAWVRLGEIAEVSRKNISEARADYMRAKNGYPFSQADLVATVRLARLDLQTEPDPAYVVKILNELLLSKSVDSDLRNMAKITLGQYFLKMGQLDEAISLAQNGMAQSEGPAYEGYKLAYMQALDAKMNALNEKGKFADALALFTRERKWFDLYGAESYRSAAETYRGLGLYSTSNEMMEKFRVEGAKDRGLASLATDPALQTLKAKNSFLRGSYSDALALVYGKNDGESNVIRALSEFRLGHKRDAYTAAEKAFGQIKTEGTKVSDLNLLQLNEIVVDHDQNERDFKRMEQDIERSAALLGKDSDELMYGRGDALWYQKRHSEAQAAYASAIEKFPKSPRVERAKYNLGMSLVSVGKRQDAVKVLTEVRDSSQSVWADSAKQELQLIEWESKYSSVLRTLPPSGLGIAN